jgi:aryl-alcohol dehydrogenase-like predicted oxidoreductase
MGKPVQMGVLTAREALRYAMSLPVACTISGAEDLHILEQNLEIAQNFVPMTPAEMQALRDRCRQYAADGSAASPSWE